VSVQRLSPKSTRRLARDLGEPTITRAWINNGFDHHFIMWVTWDHVHGWYDRRAGQQGLTEPGYGHIPSCYGEHGELLLDLDPFEDDGRWPIHGIDR
jgi:hypothetical protein